MNPYRQAREVENDALSRMTEPSPKEIGWDEGYAAGLHEAEAALEVAAQIMRDIPDAAITEGGWHNRAFGWLAAHDRRLAAATPDPPTDAHRPWPIAPDTVMPSRRQPVRWGSRADDPPTEIHDDPEKTKAYLAGLAAGRTEAPAASPDERLREAAQVAVFACLPVLHIVGSQNRGYRVSDVIDPKVIADPQEWVDAAHAICELHHVLAAADREKPDKPHTQDCQDAMFMHHAATGGDMECTCRPPVSDDPTGITRPTPEPDRRARFGRIAPHVSDDPVNDPETNT